MGNNPVLKNENENEVSNKYLKTIKRIMTEGDYILLREKNHMIWCHMETKQKITISKSPKNPDVIIKCTKDLLTKSDHQLRHHKKNNHLSS